jgi:hypothetical protein
MRIRSIACASLALGILLVSVGCLHPERGLEPVKDPYPVDPKGYPREAYPADYPLGKEPRIETGRGSTTQGEAFEDHTVNCQTICKILSEPDDKRHWSARVGMGAFWYEIGEQIEVAPVASIMRRLGNNDWFGELQMVVPRARIDTTRGGVRTRDIGRIFFYTLNIGREYMLDPDWRFRSHVGAGYFRSNSLGSNDDGFTATAGAAIQYRVYDDVDWGAIWGHLGVAWYGFVTDIDRDETSFRHNMLLELSVVWDF